ncbi:MAG: glycerol-3-phosphate acyltransferase [Polyangiaceae bacterium]|nr:glycerol-3-phosphate acyltransferase [Polyangiaceae bacterium]
MLTLLGMVVLAYLAGSVQAAVFVSRWAGKPDPRYSHSGNPGATNVYRTAGFGWAALVLLLDLGRAALVGWLARSSVPSELVPIVGLGLLTGTYFPVFQGFRGGKGVASLLGFVLGAGAVQTVGLALLAWVVGRAVTGQSFLGSLPMVTVLALGLGVDCGGFWGYLGSFGALATVIWRHRGNLAERGYIPHRFGGPEPPKT